MVAIFYLFQMVSGRRAGKEKRHLELLGLRPAAKNVFNDDFGVFFALKVDGNHDFLPSSVIFAHFRS